MRAAHAEVRPFAAASGALLALSAAPFAVIPSAYTAGAVLPSICLLSAGLVIIQKPKPGRALASLGALGLFACAAPWLRLNPAMALAALLVLMGSLAALWDVLGRPAMRRPLLSARAHGAALASLGFWLAGALLRPLHPLMEALPVAVAFLIAAALCLRWMAAAREVYRARAWALVGVMGAAGLGAGLAGDVWDAASAGAGFAVAAMLALPRAPRSEVEPVAWWEPLLGHPERFLVGTFAAVCSLGTLLLALPLCSATGVSIGLLDAAFTAVSAVCVTGLIVLDTPKDFSVVGQVVILLLIQVGGLGIMTFSTAVMRMLGRRMSLRHEGAAASLFNVTDRGQLAQSARRILLLTVCAEAVGALLLAPRFMAAGDSVGMAAWRAVFTSVSAFCNAGFALQSTNLMPYQMDGWILHTVALLIVVGGLSPVTVYALPAMVRRRTGGVPLQAKLGLAGAAALLMIGFGFFLVVEWDAALAHLPWTARLHNAWFQSATLRTAGFNSLDFAILQPATLSLSMIWMFIGGGPGGTAGGVKTTTAAVLLLSILHIVRGAPRVTVFGRHIGERTRHRAAAVVLLASGTVIAAVMALQLTQSVTGVEALFEVISALGTVGLSMGATLRLDEIGKMIIMGCMFAGRVGGLSLLMFMSQRNLPLAMRRPEEEIDVG